MVGGDCLGQAVEYGDVTEEIEDVVNQLHEDNDPGGSLETNYSKTSVLVVIHGGTNLLVGKGWDGVASHVLVSKHFAGVSNHNVGGIVSHVRYNVICEDKGW